MSQKTTDVKRSKVLSNTIRAIKRAMHDCLYCSRKDRKKRKMAEIKDAFMRCHCSIQVPLTAVNNAHMIPLKHARFVASHTRKKLDGYTLPSKTAKGDAAAHIHSFRDGAGNGCDGIMLAGHGRVFSRRLCATNRTDRSSSHVTQDDSRLLGMLCDA